MMDERWKGRETKGSKQIFLVFGLETGWAEIPLTKKGEIGGGAELGLGSEEVQTFS